MISGNMVGMYSTIGKTLIIVDEEGNELTGVITDNVHVFDATPDDVKVGKKFASSDGVLEGVDTKTYRVTFATYLIFPNENFSIPLQQYDAYDYTQFQAIISTFNTGVTDSTAATKISAYDGVYDVGSNIKISNVTKNSETKSVDLNIVNSTNDIYIIHYNTYKEEL